jgi:hypothetical protein
MKRDLPLLFVVAAIILAPLVGYPDAALADQKKPTANEKMATVDYDESNGPHTPKRFPETDKD